MVFQRKSYTLFSLLVTLVVLGGLLLSEWYINKDTGGQLKRAYASLQEQVAARQLGMISLYGQELQDTANLQRRWSRINELAHKRHLSLTIYSGNSLVLWTDHDNEVKPFEFQKDSFFLTQTPNAYLLVYQMRRGAYTFLFTWQVKTNYAFRNQYLKDRFNDDLAFIQEGVISLKPFEHMVPVTDMSGKTIFYVQLFAFSSQTPDWLLMLIVLFILAALAHIHILARAYIRSHFALTTIFFVSLMLLSRWINTFYHIPGFIYDFKLFNPAIYASSFFLPSLGDLFLDAVIVLWYFVILESGRKQDEAYTRIGPVWRPVVWLILSLVACHLSIASIKSLIIDSQVSFDISNVLTNNFFIYISLLTIIFQLLTCYFIIRNFARSLRDNVNFIGYKTYLLAGGGVLLYIAIAQQLVQVTTYQWVITTLLFLAFFIFKIIKSRQNRFQQYFVVTFIIAGIAALSIHHWVKLREYENRKLFAVSITSQNDITTDYFLRNVEKKLMGDKYVLSYFENPLITKAQFEKRIRQIYFTGYLSKYEVNVLDYDSMGYHFRQRNSYTYKQINTIYQHQTLETINTHFRYIRNSEEVKGYLGKFIIHKGKNIPGILFILLKPKLIQDENRFDDLLIEGSRINKKRDFGYSYAVYKDRFLIYQSGNFPYRTNNIWGERAGFDFFNEEGIEHLIHTDEQNLTVVVSKPADRMTEIIGLFSFIFTGCTIILILILFVHVGINAQFFKELNWLYQYLINPIRKLLNRLLLVNRPETYYIRTRLQTAIIFILFLTLLFTSYFTINFITVKYNERQTERLMKKLRNVILTVENEGINNVEWRETNELDAFINQLADFYDTDIILFGSDGLVKASSISKIYEEGIISNRMPPMAYYHLGALKESQYTENDHIGSLHFQTAYAPVFTNKTSVLGYIQLPYFSQKADLMEEISSVVVGFINLYVLLFILIGLIAYLISRNISRPLTLIQQKLGATVLLGKNEPIIWQRDDEIGELVRKYNSMIIQLENSVRQLAEKEREGAWRDIAKQIAHEIKNPLTPMKLSIQHLQRAFKNQDPDIATRIDRTTQLLITQIDTLSDLATEFSSFAKMPAPVYEPINVCAIIRQICELYSMNTEVRIESTCTVDAPLLFDPSYLNRIVGNLVKNAIQAIPEPEHGHIKVIAEIYNDKVVIHVIDNGKGMTPEEREQVFTPYFSTKISGIGLGLPIVKNMIESGNGTITFTSEPGHGTHFTITLPMKG